MLSRIETQRGEINSYFERKIATMITKQTKMLVKIQLTKSTILTLRRETSKLVDTTETSIESEYEQRMTHIRGRKEEILENLKADRTTRIFFKRGKLNLEVVWRLTNHA